MKVYLKRFPKDSLIVQTSGDLQYANSNFRSNNSETLTLIKIVVEIIIIIERKYFAYYYERKYFAYYYERKYFAYYYERKY